MLLILCPDNNVRELQAALKQWKYTYTHTHTTVLWLYGFCLGQPGWAGTTRNIHPLTLIVESTCSAKRI